MSQEQDDKLLEATQMGRRTMLKRVLIGSAVVYAAPMVATFTLDGAAAQPTPSSSIGGWGGNETWNWGGNEHWNWGGNEHWNWGGNETWNWGGNETWNWGSNETWNWGSNHSWNWGSNETWFWSPNESLLPSRGNGFLGRILRLIQRP